MSDDLHARLLAAVNARRELAQRALPWPAEVGIAVTGPAPAFAAPDRVVAHMVFNNPAQILRDTEAHLKILKRHRPGPEMPSGRRLCSCAHRYYTPYFEECLDVEALAGIYLEENET